MGDAFDQVQFIAVDDFPKQLEALEPARVDDQRGAVPVADGMAEDRRLDVRGVLGLVHMDGADQVHVSVNPAQPVVADGYEFVHQRVVLHAAEYRRLAADVRAVEGRVERVGDGLGCLGVFHLVPGSHEARHGHLGGFGICLAAHAHHLAAHTRHLTFGSHACPGDLAGFGYLGHHSRHGRHGRLQFRRLDPGRQTVGKHSSEGQPRAEHSFGGDLDRFALDRFTGGFRDDPG